MKKKVARKVLIIVLRVLLRALVIMIVWNLVSPEIIYRSMEMSYWMALMVSAGVELFRKG